MCVNLCKTPTQTFFTEELGMPLTMKPNFEDYSCDMVLEKRLPAWTVMKSIPKAAMMPALRASQELASVIS